MILLFYFILISLYSSVSLNKTYISKISKFPAYEDESFLINFTTLNETVPLYTFIVFLCKLNNKVVEGHVVNPGFLRFSPKPIYGQYFKVMNYTTKSHLIEAELTFKKEANNGTFEIFFLETSSKSRRSQIVNKLHNFPQYQLGSYNISLLLHWKLEFTQATLDHREDGLIVNSTGTISCKATGGFPFSPVHLRGIEDLDRRQLTTATTGNEIILTFDTKIENHLNKVQCEAGNDVIYDTIKIFHHPTKLEFVPKISQFVQNGSNLLCNSQDGFPAPKVQWELVSGSEDPGKYFSITGNKLHIKSNAPLKSKWSFKCISRNTIPGSINEGKAETVSFIVGDPPFEYFLFVSIILGGIPTVLLVLYVAYRLYTSRKHKNKNPIKEQKQMLLKFQVTPKDCSNDSKSLQESLYPIHLV